MESRRVGDQRSNTSSSELLILPDGQILVHNLTPAFAELLRELNPHDQQIAPRAQTNSHTTSHASLINELPN